MNVEGITGATDLDGKWEMGRYCGGLRESRGFFRTWAVLRGGEERNPVGKLRVELGVVRRGYRRRGGGAYHI